jgi:hypothetical protein
MNTLEIDTLLKKHPHSRRCLRESMPETDYPDWEIRIQTIELDNTGSLYTLTPTQEGNTTTPQEDHPF